MLHIALAAPEDAPALAEVQRRTFDDDSRRFAGLPSGGPPGYDSVAWQVRMMDVATAYYKLVWDRQIVGGVIVFDMGQGRFELGRIYVDPDFRNRGIGTQAMQFIERAHPQARRWTLGTPIWATRNHHFYEKLGYVKIGEDHTGEPPGFLYEKQRED